MTVQRWKGGGEEFHLLRHERGEEEPLPQSLLPPPPSPPLFPPPAPFPHYGLLLLPVPPLSPFSVRFPSGHTTCSTCGLIVPYSSLPPSLYFPGNPFKWRCGRCEGGKGGFEEFKGKMKWESCCVYAIVKLVCETRQRWFYRREVQDVIEANWSHFRGLGPKPKYWHQDLTANMKKSKNWLSHKLKDDGDLVNKFTVKPAILNEVIENPYSLPTAFYETMGKAYEPPKRGRIVDADTVISEGAGEILEFDEETGEVKGRREGGKETEKIGVLEKEVKEEVKEEEVKVDVVVKLSEEEKRLHEFEAFLNHSNVHPHLVSGWTVERAEWDNERATTNKIVRYYYISPAVVSAERRRFLKRTEALKFVKGVEEKANLTPAPQNIPVSATTTSPPTPSPLQAPSPPYQSPPQKPLLPSTLITNLGKTYVVEGYSSNKHLLRALPDFSPSSLTSSPSTFTNVKFGSTVWTSLFSADVTVLTFVTSVTFDDETNGWRRSFSEHVNEDIGDVVTTRFKKPDDQTERTPEGIYGLSASEKYLVKWESMTFDLATWEDRESFLDCERLFEEWEGYDERTRSRRFEMARTEGKKEVRRKKDPVVILAGMSGSDPIAYDPYRSTDSEGSSGSSVVEDIDELVLSYQAHKNVKSRVRSRGRTKTIAVKRKRSDEAYSDSSSSESISLQPRQKRPTRTITLKDTQNNRLKNSPTSSCPFFINRSSGKILAACGWCGRGFESLQGLGGHVNKHNAEVGYPKMPERLEQSRIEELREEGYELLNGEEDEE
ncbi:hypothetical protein TrST_g68 [Triparma strigata]|uniref:C2H2-type domain-containing protein n=1 Tax=Triparma strigata TaxID=1606541 RepID=A0A9W7BE82_9STRA|nr:hypothetical protein TrST_g68 [Triparma strigata]